MKVSHFYVVFENVQKDGGVYFRKQKVERLKVGIMLTWSKMTISNLAKSLFLFGFYLVQKYSFGFIIVCKQSQQIKHSNSNHTLINTNENSLQKVTNTTCMVTCMHFVFL